ncbi:MAG: HAD-superfamily hydrolase subfamily [Candidatus Kaiserbacteria bacterium]|nr:HAD-superfamily hydrolase subfamily [Candidatus Kaiserbacteria bacterium]
MPKHFFFDLDGTLTRSHVVIDPANVGTLSKLCDLRDVIVVTGGTYPDIQRQLTPALDGKYFSLAQSGGHATNKSGEELWREVISPEQTASILELIEKMKHGFDIKVRDENDCVELRGSQVSYSVLGYNEDVEKKYAFDPDFSKRKQMLNNFAADVEKLKSIGIEVAVGGTTTFNFTLVGQDKGSNVARLIRQESWDKDECLYIGDALKPGENDFAVVGVIETQAVKDPNETFELIVKMLG